MVIVSFFALLFVYACICLCVCVCMHTCVLVCHSMSKNKGQILLYKPVINFFMNVHAFILMHTCSYTYILYDVQ